MSVTKYTNGKRSILIDSHDKERIARLEKAGYKVAGETPSKEDPKKVEETRK